jgi:hypothetical protein
MRISAVPYEVVDIVWQDAKRWLEPAVKTAKGRYTIDDIRGYLDDRIIALWVAMTDDNEIKAAITTRIYDYPKGRALEMDWIGGEEMDTWLPQFQEKLEGYAKDMECDFMAGQGRRGWTKPLTELGWELEHVSFRKELTDG